MQAMVAAVQPGPGIFAAAMVPVTLDRVSRSFGDVRAVDSVTAEAPAGALTFLVGPSGCGKTTVLRMVAGLLAPDAGRILFGPDDVTALPAERRDCGLVFQNYALWPHMTVAQNVGFGLEARGVRGQELSRRVGEALEMVRMGGLGERRPAELSGGQQQRVALARAVVYRPRVLLLDEPLSNLDAGLRAGMRAQIRRTVDDLGITAIQVTHDQQEALSLADRIVLMRDGRVEQACGPREMYERPASRFAASFLGDANLLDAKAEGAVGAGVRILRTAAGTIGTLAAADRPADAALVACVRPEALRMQPDAAVPAGQPALRGVVAESGYFGDHARHRVDCSGTAILVTEPNPRRLGRRGEPVALTADPAQVAVLDG
jgi:iron(III) transport system ATP-binding protein